MNSSRRGFLGMLIAAPLAWKATPQIDPDVVTIRNVGDAPMTLVSGEPEYIDFYPVISPSGQAMLWKGNEELPDGWNYFGVNARGKFVR